MRLAEQLPNDVRIALVNSDNPFELAALQRQWDTINQDKYKESDDDEYI